MFIGKLIAVLYITFSQGYISRQKQKRSIRRAGILVLMYRQNGAGSNSACAGQNCNTWPSLAHTTASNPKPLRGGFLFAQERREAWWVHAPPRVGTDVARSTMGNTMRTCCDDVGGKQPERPIPVISAPFRHDGKYILPPPRMMLPQSGRDGFDRVPPAPPAYMLMDQNGRDGFNEYTPPAPYVVAQAVAVPVKVA